MNLATKRRLDPSLLFGVGIVPLTCRIIHCTYIYFHVLENRKPEDKWE